MFDRTLSMRKSSLRLVCHTWRKELSRVHRFVVLISKGCGFPCINLRVISRTWGLTRSSPLAALAQKITFGNDVELVDATIVRWRVNEWPIRLLTTFHGAVNTVSLIASVIWSSTSTFLRFLHLIVQFHLFLQDFIGSFSYFFEVLSVAKSSILLIEFNWHDSCILLFDGVFCVQRNVHHIGIVLIIICKLSLLVKCLGGRETFDQDSRISYIFQEVAYIKLFMQLVLGLIKQFGDGLLVACSATEGDPSRGEKSDSRDFDRHVVIG